MSELTRVHVYKLPQELDCGYAFGGGNVIPFLNVDWFDASWGMRRDDLVAFIKEKEYYDPTARFLVLAGDGSPTLTFTIEAVRR